MPLTILFFGSLTELTGVHQMEWPVQDSLWSLKEALEQRYPGLEKRPYRLTLNLEFIDERHDGLVKALRDGDEVAFLPPYAGG